MPEKASKIFSDLQLNPYQSIKESKDMGPLKHKGVILHGAKIRKILHPTPTDGNLLRLFNHQTLPK